ncbi:hypothetical protein DBZ36_09005 [Alginatibacterium sediminis]|uniref:Glycine cleavage system transcriptional repressor n=1 Tax=Alginatibacterium sediminis TaxID=2164068 RepID=A0A420ECV8_9ALTE|nr:ACT domain-containing protein [Alginatibacterium sediminis]RKF18537.1 hypothetical protein DBZ36_09005 [Alginatibacterium sediminis]
MTTEFLVTVTGRDQRDLLHRISKIAVTHHASMLKSKLVHIEGTFAGLIKMRVDQEHGNALKQELLSTDGLEVKIRTLYDDHADHQSQYRLVIDASDQAGIIHDLTELLSANSIDILHVETQRLPIQELGDTVFSGQLELSIPDDVDMTTLKQQLHQLKCAPKVHLTLS